jgi:putative ABC transport system permease protein
MFKIRQIIKVLRKFRTSSLLTILSLVISFLGVIVITLYVSFEKSFDSFNVNKESVYRFETKEYGPALPAPAASLIEKNIPEVDKQVVLWFDESQATTPKLKESNIKYYTSGVWAGDKFFDIFTLPLEYGESSTALTEPYSVVLTKTLSEKLFGKSNPVGETVIFRNVLFKVTGVAYDFPRNSSFSSDCLLSISTLMKNGDMGVNDWSEWSYNIFIKLKQGADPLAVARKIENIPDVASVINEMKERYKGQPFLSLRPLKEIHFVTAGNYRYANPVILNVFVFLAIILGVMGAVNFINFSTSQAPLRAKSLSMIRVLGGRRRGAMGQLIMESVFLSVVAMFISLLLYFIVAGRLETIFNIQGIRLGGRTVFILWFALASVVFGFIAGYYPARYVTSSPLADTIKGAIKFEGKGKAFRSVLVTVQFVFTIALISSALIIEKQLNFWRNFDIGINKENVVYLNTTNDLQLHFQAFADELMKNPDISDYTYSQFIPGSVWMGWGRDVDDQHIQLMCWPVDDRFLDFFGIKISEGRPFAKGSKADINTFILNKSAVEQFGWKNPLDKTIDGFDFKGKVIGIAENINFSSLKEKVGPMQFWLTDTRKTRLILRIKPGNVTSTAAFIKKTAKTFDPKFDGDISFLDDSLNRLYDKEEKMARFIEFVALWCMFLAVTGLLGLAIFICRDRTKEVGIRKVNGATISEVLVMINKDFVRWVLVSFIVAVPVSWYGMSKWVEGFAYKTTLSWWVFALSGLIALAIAIMTVTLQSIRTAAKNPVEALRYE